MATGNRVYLKRNLPSKEIMEKLAELPAANVADGINRNCAMHPRIRLMSNPSRPIVCGPALTVKSRAGDNLMIHKALNMAQEGDIIVVSNEGDETRALSGELMMTFMTCTKKAAGIIFDGPIRDIDAISKMDTFIYATGTTPGGPYKEGPGEVNTPIACGEVMVYPGDIIIADADGIIVIPRKDAQEAYEKGKQIYDNEVKKLEGARTGTQDRSWVEKKLAATGCEILDEVYSAD